MTLEVANILGLDKVYVILGYGVISGEVELISPIFVNRTDAEAHARNYEKDQGYQVYTEIYERLVR